MGIKLGLPLIFNQQVGKQLRGSSGVCRRTAQATEIYRNVEAWSLPGAHDLLGEVTHTDIYRAHITESLCSRNYSE